MRLFRLTLSAAGLNSRQYKFDARRRIDSVCASWQNHLARYINARLDMNSFHAVAIPTEVADSVRSTMKSPKYGFPAHREAVLRRFHCGADGVGNFRWYRNRVK